MTTLAGSSKGRALIQADLDALAWDVSEHLSDLAVAADRVERATVADTAYWEQLYGQDELLTSLPGMGPVTAPTVRAFLGDAAGFPTAKAAAGYVGITPSNWSSGTVTQLGRAITKEGPAVLRLAFYQAGNAARRGDPQLAAFYHLLISERGHRHTSATVAVARKARRTHLDRVDPRAGPSPGAQRRDPPRQTDPLTHSPSERHPGSPSRRTATGHHTQPGDLTTPAPFLDRCHPVGAEETQRGAPAGGHRQDGRRGRTTLTSTNAGAQSGS